MWLISDRDQGLQSLAHWIVYRSWGRYDKAVECYEKSLEIARNIGDVRSEAEVFYELGCLHAQQGDSEKALDHLAKALETRKNPGVPTEGTSNAIAHLHMDTGKIGKAQKLLSELSAHYDKIRNKAPLWGSLGRLHLVKSEYTDALECYTKLLTAAEENRDSDNLFIAYTGLGRVHEAQNDYEKARHYYRQGLDITEELCSSLEPAQKANFYEARIGGFPRSEPAKGLTRVR